MKNQNKRAGEKYISKKSISYKPIIYNVNPFLFTLLKRLIQFDVEKTLRYDPSIENVAHYSLLKLGNNKYAKYWEERIRKVLSLKTFNVSEDLLDIMSTLVKTLGQFNSWKSFCDVHGKSGDSIHCENFCDKPYELLSVDEKQLIRSMVERRLGFIYQRYRTDNLPSEFENRFVIKSASVEEIEMIADLAKRVYPCPINDFNAKLPWYKKNENIFFVCIDQNNELIANINLLPLKNDFYEKLKSGIVYENEINADDIYSQNERNNVNCIYVEGFASISRPILSDFRIGFEKMIFKLAANIEDDGLIVCAIGGSKEGDLLMRNYGFQIVGNAYDHANSRYYPFFEIKWIELKKIIDKKILSNQTIHDY